MEYYCYYVKCNNATHKYITSYMCVYCVEVSMYVLSKSQHPKVDLSALVIRTLFRIGLKLLYKFELKVEDEFLLLLLLFLLLFLMLVY